MDTLLTIIRDYGTLVYGILFLYCALKSGSLPLFAGIAAHLGALNISMVALVVFAGGYLGDELRFYLGRKYNAERLLHSPRWGRAMNNAKQLLDRFGTAYIFLYRYPKGMRTIGALPVTLTQMGWATFTRLNFSSAALWTFLLCGGGYLLGGAIEQAAVQYWGALSIGLLALFSAMTYIAWKVIQPVPQAVSGD